MAYFLLAVVIPGIDDEFSWVEILNFLGCIAILCGIGVTVGSWIDRYMREEDRDEFEKKVIKILRCVGWPTFVALLMLKRFGIIHWHWFWIILPIPFVLIGLLIFIVMAVIVFIIVVVFKFIFEVLSL